MITQKRIGRQDSLPDFSQLTVAGVDEAGRGALAGPVVAAAVILPKNCKIEGCKDSKKLTAQQRNQLESVIKTHAVAWATAQVSAREIDKINILQATLLAMRKSLLSLSIKPEIALIDGNQCPKTDLQCCAVVGGDARVMAISAASILAKNKRDRKMEQWHKAYPLYNFKAHKGYPTPEHLDRLNQHGHCDIHRLSYKPVKQHLLF